MNNFNKLLPPKILDKLDCKNLTLDLLITGEDCQGRHPSCRVSINDNIIFDGYVIDQKIITFTGDIHNPTANIKIEYYGKTSQDTRVDSVGNIIANQKISVSKFILNDIDIIKNNLIHQAEYIMTLDPNKEKYFKENNIANRNHNYHLYENGQWSLQIGIPVLTYIINNTKQIETFEKIPYNNIMQTIIDKLGI
jgi:hypothetical protein